MFKTSRAISIILIIHIVFFSQALCAAEQYAGNERSIIHSEVFISHVLQAILNEEGIRTRAEIANFFKISSILLNEWIESFNANKFSFELTRKFIPFKEAKVYQSKEIQIILQNMINEAGRTSRNKIAKRYRLSTSTLTNWIHGYNEKKFDFFLTESTLPLREVVPCTMEQIQEILQDVLDYTGQGSKKEIIHNYQISSSTLKRWVEKYNKGAYPFQLSHACIPVKNRDSYAADKIQKILQMVIDYSDIKTRAEIASYFNVEVGLMYKWIHKYNEKKFNFTLTESQIPIKRIKKQIKQNTISKSLQYYIDHRNVMSKIDVAKKLNTSISTLNTWIQKYNSKQFDFQLTHEIIPCAIRKNAYDSEKIQKILEEICQNNQETRQQIIERHGLSTKTLSTWIQKYNEGEFEFKLSKEKIDLKEIKIYSPEFIQQALQKTRERKLTRMQQAKELGVLPSRLKRWIKKYEDNKFDFEIHK